MKPYKRGPTPLITQTHLQPYLPPLLSWVPATLGPLCWSPTDQAHSCLTAFALCVSSTGMLLPQKHSRLTPYLFRLTCHSAFEANLESYLKIQATPQQSPISFTVCHLCENISCTSTVFCSLTYPKLLQQCLAHSRYSFFEWIGGVFSSVGESLSFSKASCTPLPNGHPLASRDLNRNIPFQLVSDYQLILNISEAAQHKAVTV